MGIKYKKRVSNPMPSYFPSTEERKWMNYCVDNNIRLFPVPTTKGMYPEEWRIGVCLGPYKKGEKPYLYPNFYNILK